MMSAKTKALPQMEGGLFLTDGGLETSLIFHEGWELPHFAAFHLLKDEAGTAALRTYYERYLAIAQANGLGFVLESPTWRASADWGDKLGYSREALAAINRKSIELMFELRDRYAGVQPTVVSGNLGPRGDGYDPGLVMSADEARDYHAAQVKAHAESGVDMVAAFTMTNANEAVGITRAAQAAGLPVAISFTVETDGRLPTGQGLDEAIIEVDELTRTGPAYYMINCAHPSHFESRLGGKAPWISRIRGIRANASRRSHAELNEAPDLDDGNPEDLGGEYRAILRRHQQIAVLGGCCGTDHRHVEQMYLACKPA